MYSPSIKRGVFWLTGINGLATTWYFFFIFFFFEQEFGFDDRKNLLVAAAVGGVFTVGSIIGGRIGQRFGYLRAQVIGYGIMSGSLFFGASVDSVAMHLIVLFTAVFGMCMTWANLEASVADGESPVSLQRNLGIYNLIWSGGNGVAYFTGGLLIDQFGLRSLFLIPAGFQIVQLILAWRLNRRAGSEWFVPPSPQPLDLHLSADKERKRSPVPPTVFLKLAWIANPFAFVAVNTAVPLIPFLAGRLELSATTAGIVCSAWFFVRTIAFGLLWKWDGWHYRFRFLSVAYVAMAVGFVGIVVANSIAMVIVSQVFFGLGLGLIYYSSLFYSMDVGETKGEHGGFHEAAIGAGLFAGPALGFAALYFFPQTPNADIKAVAALLIVGFAWLTILRFRKTANL